ncbi:protein kinase [Nonomuraea sp. NPDC050451]|uniref:protein kinase domain-containing protein n=1 Tax=Nonomuraea sp. NPDC050451 TaxID=3364364 RepID=UPI0037B37E32
MVTEYVEGPDLAAVVRQAPLTGANLEAPAVGVATAPAAIHQAGVVHRDLKPSNVLLSPVGPRVIDFGIAQLADTAGALPTVAQSMGTPASAPPPSSPWTGCSAAPRCRWTRPPGWSPTPGPRS